MTDYTNNPDRIIDMEEAAQLRNISVSTLRRQVRKGLFPAPERISERRIGWRLSVVLGARYDDMEGAQ
ncbi:MAG: helix-turn-helix transcriptional regulator [Azonexus sp.]